MNNFRLIYYLPPTKIRVVLGKNLFSPKYKITNNKTVNNPLIKKLINKPISERPKRHVIKAVTLCETAI